MKQWRAGVSLAACGGFLIAAPRCAPPLPRLTWEAWGSWLASNPERAVTLLAGFAGWLVAGWLVVVTALTLIAATASRSGRVARRWAQILTPPCTRGLIRVLLGAAVAVATGGPAIASTTPTVTVSTGSLPSLAPVPAPVLAPPELPPLLELDRPGGKRTDPAQQSPGRAQPQRPATASPRARPEATYAVRPGDTLWDLAAERLPGGSSPASITRAWQQWYAANRQEIGPDPGLLLVGERLVAPQETQ